VCLACGAILVVVPSGVGRGLRYSLSAIAYALALWLRRSPGSTRLRSRESTHVVIAIA
jgi:hypothetical protein